jgi:hypothetical protein
MEIALLLLIVAACDWVRRQVVALHAQQQKLADEVARISRHLGMPPRQVPMIQCSECSTLYSPQLTGCSVCGKGKPKKATIVMVDESAVDPDRLTAPAPDA